MNRDQAWAFMMQVCAIEEACIALRKRLCEGSFLHGHTVKVTITEADVKAAWVEADRIAAAMDEGLKVLGARP